jgi:hypothetical protein
MDQLKVMGQYLMTAWISKSQGNFNVSIEDALLEVNGELMVSEDGFLQVRKIKMDLNFGDLKMSFEKLGFLGKVFQVSSYIFYGGMIIFSVLLLGWFIEHRRYYEIMINACSCFSILMIASVLFRESSTLWEYSYLTASNLQFGIKWSQDSQKYLIKRLEIFLSNFQIQSAQLIKH